METTKKIYAPHELICAEPIHPGEMLKDELQARGISQRKFAGIIGMPYTAFNEIINGHRPITTDTALKIEAATGITANLAYNLTTICRPPAETPDCRRCWIRYAKRLRYCKGRAKARQNNCCGKLIKVEKGE